MRCISRSPAPLSAVEQPAAPAWCASASLEMEPGITAGTADAGPGVSSESDVGRTLRPTCRRCSYADIICAQQYSGLEFVSGRGCGARMLRVNDGMNQAPSLHSKLGDYLSSARSGRGGWGVVWAQHTSLGRPEWLRLAGRRSQAARLLRSKTSLAARSITHIVPVAGVGCNDVNPCHAVCRRPSRRPSFRRERIGIIN